MQLQDLVSIHNKKLLENNEDLLKYVLIRSSQSAVFIDDHQ